MRNFSPRYEKVLELATFFDLINHSEDESAVVDMSEPSVPDLRKHSCGTEACHAGWFGAYYCKHNPVGDFMNYSEIIANSLGFRDTKDEEARNRMLQYFEDNPDIWGNKFGGGMFTGARAFRKEEGKPITLKVIAEHWYKVAERLQVLQENSK